jgi:hypothetical protein
VIPNIVYIRKYFFDDAVLRSDAQLAKFETETMLASIDRPNVRLLSNHSPFRGEFRGEFYTLTWYNDYLYRKLVQKIIEPCAFLSSFDYFLFDKTAFPKTDLVSKFGCADRCISNRLEIQKESDNFILYSVKKDNLRTNLLASESYNSYEIVNVTKSITRPIANRDDQYVIEIEMEPDDVKQTPWARWQINWLDGRGAFIDAAFTPFPIDARRKAYVSPCIMPPKAAHSGVVYITSNNETRIRIHRFSVTGKRTSNLVNDEIDVYYARTLLKSVKR